MAQSLQILDYDPDKWGSTPGRGRDFPLHHCVQMVSGAHPSSYPVGTMVFSSGIEWPEHEAVHSSLSSAKVKNAQSYTSTSQYIFIVWCLIKRIICLHDVVLS